MTARMFRCFSVAMLLIVPALAIGCHSGGNQPDLEVQRPAITNLSTHSASIGDSLDVIGLNFGENQGDGVVRLNGIDFIVNSWSETQISVTVAAEMVSGTVMVTVAGRSSVGGPGAQLSILAAPEDVPNIDTIMPHSGAAGDEIMLSGSSFGSAADGRVLFPARDSAVSQAGGMVAAEIAMVNVDGAPVPRWSNSLIALIVPEQAQYGKTYICVVTIDQRSNEFPFIVTPAGPGQPAIYDVTPPSGAIGTSVTITGENFGEEQAGSTLMLGDLSMAATAWTAEEITAQVPDGAVTGDIVLFKPGFDPAVWRSFNVLQAPFITGVSPMIVDVGDSFTVYGHGFADEQGGGQLQIGGADQTVSSWTDTKLVVDSLGTLPVTGELMAVVGNDAGLLSNEVPVYYLPSFDVKLSVSPKMGMRDGPDGEPGTVFTFTASVSGGSGSYECYVIPDASVESAEVPVSGDGTLAYSYPYDPSAPDEEYIDTRMRVVDTSNDDSLFVDGPTIHLVNLRLPVITDIALADFNRLGTNAPNDACFLQTDKSYHDFSFVGGLPLITSSIGQVEVEGDPVPGYTRNLESFMVGGANQRPYGYRYFDEPGSLVKVSGFNFGDVPGQVFLNAGAANPDDVVEISSFDEWTDTAVSFKLPAVAKRLSGVVKLIPDGSAFAASSTKPLICSPYVTQLLPDPVRYPDGSLTLSGYDFVPDELPGITGSSTYAIWIISVSYSDPWDLGYVMKTVEVTTPVNPADLTAGQLTFDMEDIDVDHNGTVPVEVFNVGQTEARVVEGTPLDGKWYFFLWTGVLPSGDNQVVANSGIFSELYAVNVSSAPTGEEPFAMLTGNPTSGYAPLTVNFNAGASSDDGTIVKYEFKFDDGGGWEDYGTTATAQHTYSTPGTYYADLRVTDDDGNIDKVDEKVHVDVADPGNQFQVGVTITYDHDHIPPIVKWDYLYQVKLWDHAPPNNFDTTFFDIRISDPVEDGVEQVFTFNNVPDGQLWFSVTRSRTDWDSGDDQFGVYGPYTIPDIEIIHMTGFQYDNPPDL